MEAFGLSDGHFFLSFHFVELIMSFILSAHYICIHWFAVTVMVIVAETIVKVTFQLNGDFAIVTDIFLEHIMKLLENNKYYLYFILLD